MYEVLVEPLRSKEVVNKFLQQLKISSFHWEI